MTERILDEEQMMEIDEFIENKTGYDVMNNYRFTIKSQLREQLIIKDKKIKELKSNIDNLKSDLVNQNIFTNNLNDKFQEVIKENTSLNKNKDELFKDDELINNYIEQKIQDMIHFKKNKKTFVTYKEVKNYKRGEEKYNEMKERFKKYGMLISYEELPKYLNDLSKDIKKFILKIIKETDYIM